MNKFKKILVSFGLGLLLSTIPLTAFANSKTITKMVFGCCEKWLTVPDPAQPSGPGTKCILIAEQYFPDGVSICVYDCSAGGGDAPEGPPIN